MLNIEIESHGILLILRHIIIIDFSLITLSFQQIPLSSKCKTQERAL